MAPRRADLMNTLPAVGTWWRGEDLAQPIYVQVLARGAAGVKIAYRYNGQAGTLWLPDAWWTNVCGYEPVSADEGEAGWLIDALTN